MTTKEQYKRLFEENFLDGDKIQEGQTLSSSFCWEAIEMLLDNKDEEWKRVIMDNFYNEQTCEKINELFNKI